MKLLNSAKFTLAAFATALGLLLPLVAFAGPTLDPPTIKPPITTGANSNANGGGAPAPVLVTAPKIEDPFKGKTLLEIGTKVINLLLSLIVIAAVVVIVIAGFRMTVGGANVTQIAKAKRAILWAIVGLAVAFMSFAIVQIIEKTLQK